MPDGLTNQIATGIATQAAAVSGGTATVATMQGSSSEPVDGVPTTPYTIVGPPRGRMLSGSWEQLIYQFPMRCYLARLGSGSLTQHDVNEYLDNFLTAWRVNLTIGGVVTEQHIVSWDTDKFYAVAGEDYQAIDFVVEVTVYRSATYAS